mgnify:CR=1 FL=1
MNNIKEFIRLLGSVFCGADLFILNLCNEDKVDFIKKELGIFVVTGLTICATLGTHYYLLWSILVLLLYKIFLSNLNLISKGDGSYAFLKWLISTILAIGIITALIERRVIVFRFYIYSFDYYDKWSENLESLYETDDEGNGKKNIGEFAGYRVCLF